MIDRGKSSSVYLCCISKSFALDNFRRLNPNYEMPVIKGSNPNVPPPPLPYGNEDDPQPANPDPSMYLDCINSSQGV